MVTGGMGFIGSNFIRYKLSNNKDQIINLDNLSIGSNPKNLEKINNKNYKFIKASIQDKDTILNLVKECDLVINFAAETHVDRSIKNPEPFIDTNIKGTFNLLEAEKKTGKNIKHIQVSTDEIYGSTKSKSFKENNLLNPSNPYSATKAAADLLCQAYHNTYGMNIIITRCTNNYGPYQFPEKLIPKTIIRATNNLQIPIYGTGENRREWIYVIDHCRAIDFLTERGRLGEVYNISSGEEFTNNTLVKKILEIMGKTSNLIHYVEDRPGHDQRYSLSSEKIQKLGWKPIYKFEEALKSTVQWYLSNSDWWRPLATSDILSEAPWK